MYLFPYYYLISFRPLLDYLHITEVETKIILEKFQSVFFLVIIVIETQYHTVCLPEARLLPSLSHYLRISVIIRVFVIQRCKMVMGYVGPVTNYVYVCISICTDDLS